MTFFGVIESSVTRKESGCFSTAALGRISLAERIFGNYATNYRLARFLYEVAAINQPVADSFYNQVLAVYGNRPMREFLYPATYPFAFRSSGDTPVFWFLQRCCPSQFQAHQFPTAAIPLNFAATITTSTGSAVGPGLLDIQAGPDGPECQRSIGSPASKS